MFLIPCKYSNNSPILKCISKIKENYPLEKIVVIDSNSDDKSYFDLIRTDVFDIIEGNSNYEIGAYLKAFEKYQDEDRYYCIHDSLMINKVFSERQTNCLLLTVQWFNGFWDSLNQKEFGRSVLGDLVEENFIGTLGTMMFCDKAIMKRVYSFFKDKRLPSNKEESCGYERILGIFLGNILGCDMYNAFQGQHINFEYRYDTTYVEKIFKKRA